MEGHSPWVPVARLRTLSGTGIGLAVALATMSCERPATQLAIDLATDLDPADTTCIFVEAGPFVVGETTPITDQRVLNAALPTSFGVAAPGDDPTARVELRVTAARSCASGAPTDVVVTRTIRTGFVRHRRIDVEMFLSRECIGVPCGVDTDCDRGRCVPVDVTPRVDAGPVVAPDAGATPGCTSRGPTVWYEGAPLAIGFDASESGGRASIGGAISELETTWGYFAPPGVAPVVEGELGGTVAIDALVRTDGWVFTFNLDTFGTPRVGTFARGTGNAGLGTVMTATLPRRSLARLGPDYVYAWQDVDGTGETSAAYAAGNTIMGFNFREPLAPVGAAEVTLGDGGVVGWVSGATCTLARFDLEGTRLGSVPIEGTMECHTPEPFVSDTGDVGIVFTGRDASGAEGVFVRRYDATLAPRDAAPLRIADPATAIVARAATAGGVVVVTSDASAIRGWHVDVEGDVAALGAAPVSGDESGADLATFRASRVGPEIYVAWRTSTQARYSVLCDPYLGVDVP